MWLGSPLCLSGPTSGCKWRIRTDCGAIGAICTLAYLVGPCQPHLMRSKMSSFRMKNAAWHSWAEVVVGAAIGPGRRNGCTAERGMCTPACPACTGHHTWLLRRHGRWFSACNCSSTSSSQAAPKSPVLFDLWADSVRSCTPILCLLSTATNLSKRRGDDVFLSSRGASGPHGRKPPARRSPFTTTV